MLDVHPAHHAASTWRDFFIHIATIVLGLLIAVGLEQTVEYFHHRHQVAETRDALRVEQEQNKRSMPQRLAEFRARVAAVQNNLAVFHYLELHTGAPAGMLPGKVNWHSVGGPFTHSVWDTGQQGSVLGLMPPTEVRDEARIYRLLQVCNDSFSAYRSANSEARAYTVDTASVSDLSPQQVQEQIRLTRAVLNRLYRYGADLRNLTVIYPQFSPGPTVEELAHIVHESPSERQTIESKGLFDETPANAPDSSPLTN
jgi:hypothetical protein